MIGAKTKHRPASRVRLSLPNHSTVPNYSTHLFSLLFWPASRKTEADQVSVLSDLHTLCRPFLSLHFATDKGSAVLQFPQMPPEWWTRLDNQRRFIEWVAQQHQIDLSGKSLGSSSLQRMSKKLILRSGGWPLLRNSAPLHSLMSGLFPEHKYSPWVFAKVAGSEWDLSATRRDYLLWLAKQLKITKLDQWYGVSQGAIRANYGIGVLKKYGNSVASVVTSVRLQEDFNEPNHTWQFWRFVSSSVRWWKEEKNQREYLMALYRHFHDFGAVEGTPGPVSVDQWSQFWYSVSIDAIRAFGGGRTFLGTTRSPLFQTLAKLYPHGSPDASDGPYFEWLPWKFASLPKTWWLARPNQRRYLAWLARTIPLNSDDDWYNLSSKTLEKHHGPLQSAVSTSLLSTTSPAGKPLLDVFDGSIATLVVTVTTALEGEDLVLKERQWRVWNFFENQSRHWWASDQNKLTFFKWYLTHVKKDSDNVSRLLELTPAELVALGASDLNHFGSIEALSKRLFTSAQVEPWLVRDQTPAQTEAKGRAGPPARPTISPIWWDTLQARQKFAEYMKEKLQFKSFEDFYKLTSDQIIALGGASLLRKYNSSPAAVLAACYPQHHWRPWRFHRISNRFWTDLDNLRHLLMSTKGVSETKSLDSLYNVTTSSLRSEGCGAEFFKHYPYVSTAARKAFPKHDWQPWRFASLDPRFWKSTANQRRFFDHVGKASSGNLLRQLDHHFLYDLTWEAIEKAGGHAMKGQYQSNLLHIAQALYPERKWLPWKFGAQLPSYWWMDSQANRQEYLEWLFKTLGFQTSEDWYRITATTLKENYGERLLQLFAGSVPRLLAESLSPTHVWQPWKFERIPKGFWTQLPNQLQYLNWFYETMSFKSMEDWYKVSHALLTQHYGTGLLARYKGSVSTLLEANFPSHRWEFWKLPVAPQGFWAVPANQLAFCQWIASKELGIKQLEDWYSVSGKTLAQKGGAGLLHQYSGSISKLLKSVYSNHEWQVWRFTHAPSGFWASVVETGDSKAVAGLLTNLGQQLGINNESQFDKWYSVTTTQIKKENPAADTAIATIGGLPRALEIAFPLYHWDKFQFGAGSAARQAAMQTAQQQKLSHLSGTLFPKAEASITTD